MPLTPRARKWLTLAVAVGAASIAPLLVLLGKTAVQRGAPVARRALVFEGPTWRAETGRLDPESYRGLMVPGLLATGRLAGLAEADARALLGEPDCPPAGDGPFTGEPRLAYWVGRVGSAKPRPGEPESQPACLYLRVVQGNVVEWRVTPAPEP